MIRRRSATSRDNRKKAAELLFKILESLAAAVTVSVTVAQTRCAGYDELPSTVLTFRFVVRYGQCTERKLALVELRQRS